MKYLIKNIAYPIEKQPSLKQMLCEKIGINGKRVKSVELVKKSIDARHKNHLKFNFTLVAELSGKMPDNPDITPFAPVVPDYPPKVSLNCDNPIIIGAGPAGLFAAYQLCLNGFKPVIFEKGDDIKNRNIKVESFWNDAKSFDEDTNVQFGEGGAGAFSDGKLTARGKNWFINNVLDIFVKFGASKDICINSLPHLGSEVIQKITINMREFLTKNETTFNYNSTLQDIKIVNNKVSKLVINGVEYSSEIVILATGNAAVDVFNILNNNNIALENKPFAVGFRIEHPKSFIDKAFYGARTNLNITGAATYRLTYKNKKRNRGVYSFCMCPGGYVISASSSYGNQVVNGMSYKARDNNFSNSAIVIGVDERDYGTGNLAALNWQQSLEKKFFNSSKPFYAAAQMASDFVENKLSTKLNKTSYKPGVYLANLYSMLPPLLAESLKKGLVSFDVKIPGFLQNGMLLALESRTSCPVRIVRDKLNLNSVSACNLYPIGEGSGYAGGIVSSAADGLKTASMFSINK